ncbi:MAG: ORF6N domain-containing protein [Patescibacteria group bacterium]|jgi:hypothetical protein
MSELIPYENIKTKIYLIRGQKVMIDRDLAVLYGVETKRLNEQVRRNIKRFPSDFMFQLSRKEYENLIFQFGISSLEIGEGEVNLKSQNATLNEKVGENSQISRSQNATLKDRRGSNVKYLPYAFTEHGVAMLSSVLKSERAVEINIAIIRTFIKLRDFALNYKALAEKINELESGYKNHDKKIVEIFAALRLMARNDGNEIKEEIGFKAV